ncbi:hypothetical protein [Streptococcus pluranimalium]|uniref:hypothetical protein n=1 Tax=Streptococcus pluranimalium TaxID=82348 RepID=UPI0039FBC95E
MAKADLIFSYEDSLVNMQEIRESLDLIHDWLSKEPKFDDYWTYHDLIACHGQHFALLNLVRYRMDSLATEHREIIEKAVKKGV